MRKAIGLAAALAALCLPAASQTVNWEIKLHSTNLKTLEAEVNGMMRNAFRPMGITYDNRELYILYIQDPDFAVSSWLIEWYSTLDELQKKVTANMRRGLVPMGVTFTGDKFFILYLETESTATHWQLEPSGTDLESVQSAVAPWSAQGYVPVGITFFRDEYWTLMLKIPGTAVKNWLIESYEVGQHGESVNEAIRRGYLPWGLEYSGDRRIDILYVAFQ
jgi:hypothetical protein